jgi:hypothetical protein
MAAQGLVKNVSVERDDVNPRPEFDGKYLFFGQQRLSNCHQQLPCLRNLSN